MSFTDLLSSSVSALIFFSSVLRHFTFAISSSFSSIALWKHLWKSSRLHLRNSSGGVSLTALPHCDWYSMEPCQLKYKCTERNKYIFVYYKEVKHLLQTYVNKHLLWLSSVLQLLASLSNTVINTDLHNKNGSCTNNRICLMWVNNMTKLNNYKEWFACNRSAILQPSHKPVTGFKIRI